ncbi:MAG: helix-turn-helix transcriptional regulator [Bacteroidota bacterium]|nr:helix-turn-helix transcriptional regulator [Bacteroidota bacterium]MDP4234349.1 helix-turn-helix transcriptional regulator [Bacteroidota bacterium]MDP4243283.1 helix-turn-helix transcriptional regulator [Bacteroidota bacterium]MDP4289108.1 helix-turn-helix transcriptional regulator [Bacteroidota bacterium]
MRFAAGFATTVIPRVVNNRSNFAEKDADFSGLSSWFLPNRDSLSKRPRGRRYLEWEEVERASNGHLALYRQRIAERYPCLTPTELRVCTLVKASLPSWKIAEILGVCEETVENHRSHARRKMCLNGESLASHLATL